MKKNNLLKTVLMVVFTILFLWSCRQESLYEDTQNDNNQKVHNKISLNTFKQETKVSKIEEFTVLKNSKSNGKDAGATSTFIIDSTSIYKLAVNNNLTTYSFRAYNIYETPDKVYNVVYRKTAGKVAYSIIEFLQDKTIKPIYDSEKGALTETKPSTSSRICLDHWSVDVWHCKNGKTWEDCDKCFKCFEHYSGYSSYDCGGETGGSDTGSVDPSNPVGTDPVEYDPNLPPPYYIPTDPSGYVFDPNEPPSIDEYYVRASRAYSYWDQLDPGIQIWAEHNPEIYNFLLENYLNHYSTTNNTNNLQFANWGIDFFKQNPTTSLEQFQNWFMNINVDTEFSNNLLKQIVESNYKIENFTINDYPGKIDGMPFEWWNNETWMKDNIRVDPKKPNEQPNAKEILLFMIYKKEAILHVKNSKNALTRAEELVQNNTFTHIHNGKADAFRHSFWNALDASDFGKNITLQFTTAHEWNSSNHPLETKMDLNNNLQGATIGENFNIFTSSSVIETTIIDKMKNTNGIWYLTPLANNDGDNILTTTVIKPTNQ